MNLLSNIFKKKGGNKNHVLLDNQESLFDSEKRTIILPPNGKKSPRSPKNNGLRRDVAGEENDEDEEHPTIYCVSGIKGLLKADRKWLTACSISDEVIGANFNVVLTILNFLRRKDLIYYKFIDQPEQILALKEQREHSNPLQKQDSHIPSVIVSSTNVNGGGNSVSSSRNNSGCSNYSPTFSSTMTSTDQMIINFEEISNLKPVLSCGGGSDTISTNGSSNNSSFSNLSSIASGIVTPTITGASINNPHQIALPPTTILYERKRRIDQNRIFISPGVYCRFPEETDSAIDKLLREGNPKEHFKNLDFEAKGGFGSVFAAKNKNIHSSFDKLMVALKKMPHKTAKQKRMNLNEIGFLKFCNHPNIVKFICSYQKSDELWLIMEFMEGGTLREAISNFNFCERRIAFIAREMLQGIQYLHKNGLCHRDLKSSNIMISMKGEIKIIDFGLAIDFNNEKEDIHMCGSPFWMPPEQIHGQPHSFSVDIWSFGVCVAEMLKGKVPNHSSRLKAMVAVATEGLVFTKEQYPDWSDDALNFLQKCLQVDPTKRLCADQLLEHPFLSKACNISEIKEILPALFMSHTLARQGLF